VKPDPETAATTVRLLDLVMEFFEDGRYWLQRDFTDDDGKGCLVDALRRMRRVHALYGDAARRYLTEAMPERLPLQCFNDLCDSFSELRTVIARARQLAVADAMPTVGSGELAACRAELEKIAA
jgi:hypothetical protein